jgi:predicted nucleotidyltransferase component of viral defense system
MKYSVLDQKRKKLLPLFQIFKKDFYLAGGTGLALQLGHRKSYDFDFFSEKRFNENKLFKKIISNLNDHQVQKTLADKSSLFVVFDNEINVNFLYYRYPLIKPTIKTKYISLASLEDIACMKLLAISERIEFKDYVDIYYILKSIPLKKLIISFEKKIKDVDVNFILKTLVDFEEVEIEPLEFMPSKKVNLEKIKKFIIKEVKNIYK